MEDSMAEAAVASAQSSSEQFDVLNQAYMDYKVCAQNPASLNSKCQLTALTEKLQDKGVYGSNALEVLNSLKQKIGWQNMHPEEFRRFYQFVFFICRDQGKRNVRVPVAIAAWRELLQGRFRLLDRWCSFMTDQYKALVVTEDTWVQVLEFSRTVHEDLGNYDPTAAWPVVLDEFVEHLRRSAKKPAEPMDLYNAWPSEQFLAAVSPRSGSKRRMSQVGVAEVAEQLQQLPLACATAHQQQPVSAGDRTRTAGQHMVKRYRAGVSAAAAAPTAAGAGAGAGFCLPAAGQPGCDACEGPASAHRLAGGLHPMANSMGASCNRPGCAGYVQQQQHDGCISAGSFSFGMGAIDAATTQGTASSPKHAYWGQGSSSGQPPVCINNLGAGQPHQAGQLPGGRMPPADAFRCSSVNAMMQATVTDTLFYT